MQRTSTFVVLCLILFAPLLIETIDVAVPSYIYPGTAYWQNIVSAGTEVKIALINPLNGKFCISSPFDALQTADVA